MPTANWPKLPPGHDERAFDPFGDEVSSTPNQGTAPSAVPPAAGLPFHCEANVCPNCRRDDCQVCFDADSGLCVNCADVLADTQGFQEVSN